jgi:GT2 family glycosyltransferase
MSNYATPPQLVEKVPYRSLEEMHGFARRWREEHRGQWFTAGKLSGFCLLMKRSVYQTIGGLDERFGLGFFDDDDLAVRARWAGFELAVAHDLFVHHFGSRTFAGNGLDAERLLAENGRKFAEKWGTTGQGQGQPITLQAWNDNKRDCPQISQMDADGGIKLEEPENNGDTPTINQSLIDLSYLRPSAASADKNLRASASLTMIVRNEEGNLRNALTSVAGLFDEIVVVDTGSTDRTKEIASEFGAAVFDFAWIDDFSAARNVALEHATGDYAFWLDADDVIDPHEREKLEVFLAGLNGHDRAAYVIRCACDPDTNGNGGQTVVDHNRLFPLRPDIRWTYRVHEQILPALRRVNIPVRWTDITVRHTGYTDPELRERKLQRDERILREEIMARPGDPFVLFNLGSIAIERQQWERALEFLCPSLAGSAPSDSITRKLFALIARCHEKLGNPARALAVCTEGLSFIPEDAELLFRKAFAHRQLGQSVEAEAAWRRILELKRPENFCSHDQGIYGHLTLRNLAVLAEERGDGSEASRLWQAILTECPGGSLAVAGADARRPREAEAADLR